MTTTALRRNLTASFFILCLGLGASLPALAELKTEVRDYRAGDTELRGYLAWDDAFSGPRPGVLVIHEWWGHDEYARQRAEQLAAAGFTAFALDMYGKGRLAEHPEDAQRFMQALLADLPTAQRRFEAALDVLRGHATVDGERTAAIGYCLGGGLALYLARTGADLDAVVSYHGALQPASQVSEVAEGARLAPMMVFTGGADPMIPSDQVADFVSAMLTAGVEINVTSYPQAQHSFTVPEATARGQKLGLPLAYDAEADADSWRRTLRFLNDRLASR